MCCAGFQVTFCPAAECMFDMRKSRKAPPVAYLEMHNSPTSVRNTGCGGSQLTVHVRLYKIERVQGQERVTYNTLGTHVSAKRLRRYRHLFQFTDTDDRRIHPQLGA